jgi:(p)ppGpp synthase/HD superfamily hydrolase
MMVMDYKDAAKLATRKHKGQYRKGGGLYISHPLAVAEKFDDECHKNSCGTS